jgi:hypothetical protein
MAGAFISSFSLSFSAALSLQACASFLFCLIHSFSIFPAALTLILAAPLKNYLNYLKALCYDIFAESSINRLIFPESKGFQKI